MNTLELIRTRRSVRTFDGAAISPESREKLRAYVETIRNPYDMPIDFILLDAKERGLSSPVIKGETLYMAAKVAAAPHSEEAFGFSFEKFVLYAWSLGIGTTWIAGTMKRDLFEKAAEVRDGERMYCVTPLGYPAEKMALKEIAMRKGIKADERLPADRLFFEGDFQTPLANAEPAIQDALEATRLAPSAANRQPWRVVRDGNAFHFYVKHDKGFASKSAGDVQKVDMGIALCHFMSVAGGTLALQNPGVPTAENVEYIATVRM